MKMKEFGSRNGARVPDAPLRSANGLLFKIYECFFKSVMYLHNWKCVSHKKFCCFREKQKKNHKIDKPIFWMSVVEIWDSVVASSRDDVSTSPDELSLFLFKMLLSSSKIWTVTSDVAKRRRWSKPKTRRSQIFHILKAKHIKLAKCYFFENAPYIHFVTFQLGKARLPNFIRQLVGHQ